ncbi:MAG: AbrB/MazE/SpoVT family DNA-binding domain-containing protein [Lautropia sp.]|nr:AbrB/MazE/SpoVT family DNA-binding domain-containing protein [Lautropia sp.]
MNSSPVTTRLSTKGQIVLPSRIRRAHQWRAGTEFTLEEHPDGLLLKPVAVPVDPPLDINEVAGMLKPRRPPVSLSDMEAAIIREARERHARGRY